jgi:hypothetical protein
MSGSGSPDVDGTFDPLSQNVPNLEIQKKRKKGVQANYQVTPSSSQTKRFIP